MGSFGEMLWILHSVGLYAQISANLAVDNHISGNGRREELTAFGVVDVSQMSCLLRQRFWGIINAQTDSERNHILSAGNSISFELLLIL